LGKAIAQRFAAEGASVAIAARTMDPGPKYQGSLRQTCEEIKDAGGAAMAVQADLSNSNDRLRLFAEVVDKIGAPDILVNNAAVTFLRPLDEFPEKRARLMVEMHVVAPAAPDADGDPGHARARSGLDSEPHIRRGRPTARAAIRRFR
jgi:NAD(P)-dependent dehydrogenase (short-subunit alcohol dehydrogenase family)